MASLAAEFAAIYREGKAARVSEVAERFLEFFRAQFDEHYRGSPTPSEFRDAPEFLLGGFGIADRFPSLYRIHVKEGRVSETCIDGSCGIYWNGQADAVERLLFGSDFPVRKYVENTISSHMQLHHEAMSKAVLEILSQVLERSGQALPQGIDTELPQPPTMTIPWSKFWLSIDVANLPLQAAIDLVSYLVLLQSGRSRFSEGVATVGGRIHIGIVRKNLKFEMLNEPGLEHKYTGFGENA